MADREQLTLFAPAAATVTDGGQQRASCDGARAGVLFVRGCSPRLRSSLRRFREDHEIASDAQAVRILVSGGLRRGGYM